MSSSLFLSLCLVLKISFPFFISSSQTEVNLFEKEIPNSRICMLHSKLIAFHWDIIIEMKHLSILMWIKVHHNQSTLKFNGLEFSYLTIFDKKKNLWKGKIIKTLAGFVLIKLICYNYDCIYLLKFYCVCLTD